MDTDPASFKVRQRPVGQKRTEDGERIARKVFNCARAQKFSEGFPTAVATPLSDTRIGMRCCHHFLVMVLFSSGIAGSEARAAGETHSRFRGSRSLSEF